jgi:hypothetical protein
MGVTDEGTRAFRDYEDALVSVKDEQRGAERADIDLERAKLRLTESQQRVTEALDEYGENSPEYQGAVLDLRDAELDLLDAEERAAQAATDLNDAIAAIPKPNGGSLQSWMEYYQKIGDKAAYAAAQALLATGAMSSDGRARSSTGGYNIPVYGTGTFARYPHLAMVGDEPEVIIPLGNKAAADKYLPMVFDSLPGGPSGGPSVAPSSVAGRTTNYYLGDIQVPPGDAQAEQVFAGLIEMAERYGRMVPAEEM